MSGDRRGRVGLHAQVESDLAPSPSPSPSREQLVGSQPWPGSLAAAGNRAMTTLLRRAPQAGPGVAPAGNAAVARLVSGDGAPAVARGRDLGPPLSAALRDLPGGGVTRPLPSVRPAPAPGRPGLPAVPTSAGRLGPGASALFQLAAAAQLLAGPAQDEPAAGGVPTAAVDALAGLGSGHPLPTQARAPFEGAYGYRLDPVRVHAGPAAARASAALGAQAVTLGDHVLLGGGTDLSTQAGRFVLGHELAHVVQARRSPTAGRGVLSSPMQASEQEATRASLAALEGRPTELVASASDDPQALAWFVLALVGLAVAGGIAGVAYTTGHGVEANRANRVRERRGTTEEVLAWVPIAGSVEEIWQAESELQLAFGIGFLAFDVATLGGTGMVVRALARVPGPAMRMLARRGAERAVERAAEQGIERAAVRVGGEVVAEEALEQASRQIVERGGAVSATTASAEVAAALGRDGAMVFAVEGGHAVLYASRGGQIFKVHGGPLFVRLVKPMGANASEVAARSVAGGGLDGALAAYAVVESGAPLTLQAIERMRGGVAGGVEAAGRAVFGNPTSCGILQGAAIEASGLTDEAIRLLLPSGGASGRYLPIVMVDRWLETGAGRIVEGGAGRILYGANGTSTQGTMAIVQVLGRTILPSFARTGGAALGEPGGVPAPRAPARAGTSSSSQDTAGLLAGIDAGRPDHSAAASNAAAELNLRLESAAGTIVRRWGTAPAADAVRQIRAALPDLVPGWLVMSAATGARLRTFLRSAGMDAAAADAVVNG